MSDKLNSAIAVIGIDIGKNSFHDAVLTHPTMAEGLGPLFECSTSIRLTQAGPTPGSRNTRSARADDPIFVQAQRVAFSSKGANKSRQIASTTSRYDLVRSIH